MRLGLALGGGGARGFAHIGVIEVLEKENIKFDIISGTSMGAIIGAFYSQYKDIEVVKSKMRSVVEKDIIKELESKFSLVYSKRENTPFKKAFVFVKELYIWNLRALKRWFIDHKPFVEIFKEVFGELEFNSLNIPLICVATDLISGKAFYLQTGPIWQALVSTMALPGIFPPFRYEDKILVDGGIVESLPVFALRQSKIDFVLGVELEKERKFIAINSGINILLNVDEIRHYRLIDICLKNADFLISPQVEDYSWADFSKIDEIIDKGREEAFQRVSQLKKEIRKRKIKRIFIPAIFNRKKNIC